MSLPGAARLSAGAAPQFLVTEVAEVGENEYLDPKAGKVHTVDHMEKVGDCPLPVCLRPLRALPPVSFLFDMLPRAEPALTAIAADAVGDWLAGRVSRGEWRCNVCSAVSVGRPSACRKGAR